MKPIKLPFTVDIGHLYWSYDSQSLLVYYEPGDTGAPDQTQNITYEYDLKTTVATRTATKDEFLDLGRSRLTKQDESLFHPARGSAQISSPNGRYLTYVPLEKSVPKSEPGGFLIYVGDRQTGKSINTSIHIREPNLLYYEVHWNRNSSAFAVIGNALNSYGVLGIRRLKLSPKNEIQLSEATAKEDDRLYSFVAQGEALSPQQSDVFMFSDDGNRALLLLSKSSRVDFRLSDELTYLALVNLQDPSSTTLIKRFDGRQVYAATFDKVDESLLWIVDDAGLHQYDMNTGTSKPVSSAIARKSRDDFGDVHDAQFSPDRKWLAWTRHNSEIVSGAQYEVFLMALP